MKSFHGRMDEVMMMHENDRVQIVDFNAKIVAVCFNTKGIPALNFFAGKGLQLIIKIRMEVSVCHLPAALYCQLLFWSSL